MFRMPTRVIFGAGACKNVNTLDFSADAVIAFGGGSPMAVKSAPLAQASRKDLLTELCCPM